MSKTKNKKEKMMKKVETFSIRIFCQSCRTLLYKYTKEGPGKLVKCFVDRISDDHTRGDCKCHQCGQQFARVGEIRGRRIHKIIQGKIYVQGSTGKK